MREQSVHLVEFLDPVRGVLKPLAPLVVVAH